jgi:hypothetical protein
MEVSNLNLCLKVPSQFCVFRNGRGVSTRLAVCWSTGKTESGDSITIIISLLTRRASFTASQIPRRPLRIGAAQQGHRISVLASATINLRRIVAIEFGTWHSVRKGGASGSVTVGNGKFFEQRGGTRSRGGNRLPLGDQESVGGDAQRGMVMEAAPAPAFEMPESNLSLEFLVIALYPPTELGEINQFVERDVFRKC